MKKFLLLLGTMFLLASCTKEEETMTASQQPDMAAIAPPIYGYAMLKDVPETRGVANKMKVWNKTMAREELSVKFLNGSEVAAACYRPSQSPSLPSQRTQRPQRLPCRKVGTRPCEHTATL